MAATRTPETDVARIAGPVAARRCPPHMTWMTGGHHRWTICLAAALVLSLAAGSVRSQTNNQTMERVLGNQRPLPLPTEPYARSQADQLYYQQQLEQSQQSQGQAVQSQQQLIDRSGQQLQQTIQSQQQRMLLQQQQYQDYRLLQLQKQQLKQQ